ncbi:MAG: electron transporter, partial [Alphaproteobacteria bacterium]|nr:electron transporter [Alphaproteobacteria bacterium]
LKAHLGSHNYPLPGGVGAYRSVVIYSQPFDVIFAVASIQ